MPQPSARPAVQSLSASLIRDVANTAMGREGVLPFWFGESDQPTPGFIREAAMASLQQGETFYSQNLGRPWLREGIASYLSHLHHRPFTAEQIGVTGSGVSALMLAMQLVLSPGDRVVAVTPLWPNLVEIPRVLSAHVERVPLQITDQGWQLDLQRLLDALTPDTRLLLINSPNNPTGWTITDDEQRIVLEHCRKHGIWILADDVYERLVYRSGLDSAPSFLAKKEDDDLVIGVNSFSKAWCMTGWRAGWLTIPAALADDLAKLVEYNTSCVPEFVQRGAMAAIQQGEPHVGQLRQQLGVQRQLMVEGLTAIDGVTLPYADGAMYAFFRIAGFSDSLALARALISEVGLGLAPGRAFGEEGEGWLRWCYATSPVRLQEGLQRLNDFVRRQR
ncbi:aspartate aminotransferase [Pokkaliibacter plantistimulans]|uniref:Aspartate aminotransferase n=1 Tax=Proteobacteria bacterium 228 TaxID=2083153 RepID=A0A2S5KSQ0_9PROT|nr:pyridoxal phosphate-dependent aminotransferase [Pokkaliibacter plantistimulans]PPC77881.1 aspartate aminotransferase [Pokkaliibacter plantistimulans]